MVLRIFEIESKKRAINKIGETGADERAYPYLYPKMIHLSIEIKDVRARDANIIKQEMLSKGGDASISRDSYSLKNEVGKILLTGNLKCYLEVAKKLRIQPIKRIKVMVDEIEDGIRNYLSEPFFKVKDEVYKKPLIVGILNITPDSFSDGGKFIDPQRALQRAVEMQNEGADIIDIGGESTRPGFTKIGIDEEEGRVIPVIKKIVEDGRVKVPLSMDTTKLEIVEKCLKLGVDIINDQSGLRMEKRDNDRFAKLVRDYDASIILMHNKKIREGAMFEVIESLGKSVEIAERNGIEKDRISIDPGIGFGKNVEQNLEVLSNLKELKTLGKVITVGASRKSFIGKTLNKNVNDRIEGSLATLVCALTQGARIVRVHDVKESALAARMAEAILKKQY